MADQASAEATFTATHVIEYDYRRSVGPVLGAFFSGLQDGKLLGAKAKDGRVLCPPAEYDPDTGEATGALVEVGPGGTVTSWTWVSEPQSRHPLSKPFAFALIQVDGADTELLHVVDAGSEGAMSTGMRVAAKFRADPQGGIGDLERFVPEGQ
ncbi:MAG: OB-fold domain-containing protein [Deltaproteobacteria bacterium]|nr:OB-fold domain-containing protein [Deltaproteobacteria bacterium]